MNILIVDLTTEKMIQKDSDSVPPIGAGIGCFGYAPYPTVVNQVWYPRFEEISKFNLINHHVDVIVFAK